jgi:hypothetical protein
MCRLPWPGRRQTSSKTYWRLVIGVEVISGVRMRVLIRGRCCWIVLQLIDAAMRRCGRKLCLGV